MYNNNRGLECEELRESANAWTPFLFGLTCPLSSSFDMIVLNRFHLASLCSTYS